MLSARSLRSGEVISLQSDDGNAAADDLELTMGPMV